MVNEQLGETLNIALDTIIRYKFLKIKNLTVEDSLITFEEGTYTKEEVESFLDEIKNKDY